MQNLLKKKEEEEEEEESKDLKLVDIC